MWTGRNTWPRHRSVEYRHEALSCEGYSVYDTSGAKRPGILVFPEWVGVGEYTHKRAQMLCELGYNAFVVDVYGKGIRPNTPETCEAEMMKYATNRPLLRARARCGLDELRKLPEHRSQQDRRHRLLLRRHGGAGNGARWPERS